MSLRTDWPYGSVSTARHVEALIFVRQIQPGRLEILELRRGMRCNVAAYVKQIPDNGQVVIWLGNYAENRNET